MEKINVERALERIHEHWKPHIAAEVNDFQVKLAKVKGEFEWHAHEAEDELFLVIKGCLRIEFRDREVELGPGELIVVPRGVEHKPVADDEAHVLLFEPATTVNTGAAASERTVRDLPRLQ